MKNPGVEMKGHFGKPDRNKMNTTLLIWTGVLLALCGIHIAPLFAAFILLGLVLYRLMYFPHLPDRLTIILLSNYLYWLILVIWKEPLEKAITYDFLRWSLRGAFGYLPLLVFSLGQIEIRGKRPLGKLIECLIIPACLVAGVGILIDWLSAFSFLKLSRLPRPFPLIYAFNTVWFCGLLRSHEVTGAYYAVVSFFTLILFLFGKYNRRIRLLLFSGFMLCFWGLVGSKARIYLGAFLVSAFSWFLLSSFFRIRPEPTAYFRVHLTRVMSALLTAIFIYVSFPGARDRVAVTIEYLADQLHEMLAGKYHPGTGPGILASEDKWKASKDVITIRDRFASYKTGIELFKEHPWTGSGFGKFGDQLIKHKQELLDFNEETVNQAHAHNSYLHIAGEMGTVGFLLFYGFWFAMVYRLYRRIIFFSGGSADDQLIFCLTALALVAGFLAAAFFDHSLWSPQIMLPLSTLAGMAIYGISGEGGYVQDSVRTKEKTE